MKPALKWGIAGAAGIAIALAIKNISDENEETEQKAQLALQQLAESSQSSQIVKSYGEWREISYKGDKASYWNLPAPAVIPDKQLISLEIESKANNEMGVVAYKYNNRYGMIIVSPVAISDSFRIVANYI